VGQEDVRVETRLVPTTITPGNYFLGVLANADGAIDEAFVGNNAGVTDASISVFEAALTIVTERTDLARAVLGVPYEFGLEALGGVGPITWSVAPESSLPLGLSVDATNGALVSLRLPEAEETAQDRRLLTLVALAASGLAGSVMRFAIAPPPGFDHPAAAGLRTRAAFAAIAIGVGAVFGLMHLIKQLARRRA
jgi:hypothetical protein